MVDLQRVEMEEHEELRRRSESHLMQITLHPAFEMTPDDMMCVVRAN